MVLFNFVLARVSFSIIFVVNEVPGVVYERTICLFEMYISLYCTLEYVCLLSCKSETVLNSGILDACLCKLLMNLVLLYNYLL